MRPMTPEPPTRAASFRSRTRRALKERIMTSPFLPSPHLRDQTLASRARRVGRGWPRPGSGRLPPSRLAPLGTLPRRGGRDKALDPDLLRVLQEQRRMGRGRDHAAALTMAFENDGAGFPGRRCRGRRSARRGARAAGARRAAGPAPPGGAGRPRDRPPAGARHGRGPPRRAPRARCSAGFPRKSRAKARFSSAVSADLRASRWPDIVQAFGQGPLAGILEADRARCRVQAAGQDVEQGGFAGAVAAGDHQGLAGRKGE